MTESSIVLRKKLHELESDLAGVFRLPLVSESARRYQIIADDIQQRFIFLKNLLSAEIASQPHSADQLQEIEQKLGELESAFRSWDEYRRSARAGSLFDDTLSVCSDCAVTFFNDDDDDFGTNDPPASADLKLGGEKAGRNWREMGRYCGLFGSGFIIGAICVIGLFTYSSYFIRHEAFFPVPT